MTYKIQDYLKRTTEENWAIGHFNFSEDDALRAIVESAALLKTPVFVGTSEGERKHIGVKQAVNLVKAFQEEFGIPIFLNADHHKSFEGVKETVDAGYDAILADFSALPFEENIKLTKQSVEYAKSKNPDIIVEGELGYLRGESKIQKEIIEIKAEDLTKPEEAAQFVKETGVDMLAPAVGNIHGIAANAPKLDFARISEIKKAVGDVTLVLHGGSGMSEDDFKNSIVAGISMVHINTEIRVAFTEALKETIEKIPSETTPYKILTPSIEAMKKVIEEKLTIFGSINKI
ncbi:MAG: class II fructose-bisphosphate aldolase [Parcubacteria group bacterium]|nr:class II fructose-bisphosphate aldolase [Parcubacteria group bacterium]